MCHDQLLIDWLLLFVDSLIFVVVFLCYTVVSIIAFVVFIKPLTYLPHTVCSVVCEAASWLHISSPILHSNFILVFLFRAADQTNWSDIDLLKRAVTSLSVWPSAAYYYRAKTLRVTSLIEIFEQIVFDSKTFVIIYRMHLSKMNSAENLAGLMQCRINPFRGSYANTKWGPF